jgi:hypothetical protein
VLEGGGWSAQRSGRSTTGKDPVPIVQEAGWVQGPVSTCAKHLAPTGIRSSDRPACSQSLYRLSYPAHHSKQGSLLIHYLVVIPRFSISMKHVTPTSVSASPLSQLQNTHQSVAGRSTYVLVRSQLSYCCMHERQTGPHHCEFWVTLRNSCSHLKQVLCHHLTNLEYNFSQ